MDTNTEPVTTPATLTRSQVEADNVRALVKARNSVLWITTTEEARVEAHLASASQALGYMPRFWDCNQGMTDLQGRTLDESARPMEPDYNGKIPPSPSLSPDVAMAVIKSLSESGTEKGGVWIMRDMAGWLTGPSAVRELRQLRNLARSLPSAPVPQAIIVLTPSAEVPPELQGHATVIEWPRPDRTEVAAMLDRMVAQYKLTFENGSRESAIDSAVGLSGEEAESCFAKSIVQLKRIDPAAVAQEKKRIIAKTKTLEWMDRLEGGFDAVGGLDILKSWTLSRTCAYSPRARAYGLPAPRGVFLVGVSGCGKSYTARALATVFDCPLFRLDIGALKSKFVGESEANFRRALQVIESTGRCVVLIDEIEKALAGATQGAADGGVSADALGALLTWMQERKGQAFLVATSNDVTGLPPELLRKGRWDELFWIDLPTTSERAAILRAALKTHGRNADGMAIDAVAQATQGFSGAELAALIPDALFAAFADGEREPSAEDLMIAARNVTPLSETAKEKIDTMRRWSKGRTRPATTPDVVTLATAPRSGRALDI